LPPTPATVNRAQRTTSSVVTDTWTIRWGDVPVTVDATSTTSAQPNNLIAKETREAIPLLSIGEKNETMTAVTSPTNLGGAFTLPGTTMTVNRMGYGAMQLPGPGVWGPPSDADTAIAILREAVEHGVNHIDTSDFYGPHVANHLIRRALHPYPAGLVIVTKVGYRRGEDKSWQVANAPAQLMAAVHDNLHNLGRETLDVVNLRMSQEVGETTTSIEEPLMVLADLQRQGLIRHLGVSNVTAQQVAQAQAITPIVCVQNYYNVLHRVDDPLIDELARQQIPYTPFFPLGGFTPLQSAALTVVAQMLGATSMQVALAWLLQRSPNILLIPGTSSLAHLRENLQAATLSLPPSIVADLNQLAAKVK